jgi:hypothetical protein
MVTRVMSGLSTTTKEKTAIGLLVLFALIFALPSDLYAAAEILGSWTEGTTHTAESGSDRALIFTAHVEDNDTDMNITSVTYGGQSMTKVIEQNHGTVFRVYVAAFILDEAGINAASSNTFNVTWAQDPFATPGYSSVFLGNIVQSIPIGASEGNGISSGYTVTTNPLSTNNGDIVVVAGTHSNTGTYSVNNGFTEAIELTVQSADGVVGYKQATGVNETPSITHSLNTSQVIIGFVVQSGENDPPTPNPASFSSAPAAVSYTEITMTATVGTDATGPVEYYFANITDPNHDSGWVTDPVYNDTDLSPNTQYTYTVQMRDAWLNTGGVSTPPRSATTERAPDLIVATSGGDYTTIQDAINACSFGWIVEVADGFWGGTGNRDIDFGGKAITVRSASGPENCTIDCGGGPTTPHRAFYFHSGEDANSIVEGFTIQNGYVIYNAGIPGMDDFPHGGAILCTECTTCPGGEPSSPTIRNCIIINNHLDDALGASYGGAISSIASAPIISDCVISSNSAYYGGGISCENSDYLEGPVREPTITNCTISDNVAICSVSDFPPNGNGYGGGIYCVDSSVVIDNCTIIGNSAFWGGGVGSFHFEGPEIPYPELAVTRCTISSNTATYGDPCSLYDFATGGGIGMLFCGGLISQCTITGNMALNFGGGLDCAYTSELTIANCIISGNSADNGNPDIVSAGGAISCLGSSPTIVNCTISSNEAWQDDYYYGGGGGIFCEGDWFASLYSQPEIKNCIFENNGGCAIREDFEASDPNLSFSLFHNNPDGDYYDWDDGPTGRTSTGAVNINSIPDGFARDNIDGDPRFMSDPNEPPEAQDPNEFTWTDEPSLSDNRTTLYDWRASFVVDELVGKHINANSEPNQRRQAYIIGNTATTIEVVGDLTGYVAKSNKYKIIDYHLRTDSPCIDTGTSRGAPITDIEGNVRPVDAPGVRDVTEGNPNADGVVDFEDVLVMANNWLRQDCDGAGTCGGADIAPPGGDGIINYLDFSSTSSYWFVEALWDIGAYELQTGE